MLPEALCLLEYSIAAWTLVDSFVGYHASFFVSGLVIVEAGHRFERHRTRGALEIHVSMCIDHVSFQ